MTSDIPALLILLFGHWLADFVCQTRWQADNKSKRLDALASHVATYGIVISPFFMAVFWFAGIKAAAILILINVLAHFVVDFVTSRMTSAFWRAGRTHGFFIVIGADQFLHSACLGLTVHYGKHLPV